MKINFAAKLMNLEDDAILKDGEKDVTLGSTAINALLAPFQDEQLRGEEKLKLYDIAMRVKKSPQEDFSVEEVAKIKERIGRMYSTLVVGQAWALLDPKT